MAASLTEFPFTIRDVAELLHLRIRRSLPDSDYADCPFCGDRRGKMNINYTKNVWRCNYCDESGGMLDLYAKTQGISKSDAYHEICQALQADAPVAERRAPTAECKMPATECRATTAESKMPTTAYKIPATECKIPAPTLKTPVPNTFPQSERAGAQDIHRTYSALINMLTLTENHRRHLLSPKRGLDEEQIQMLDLKSTPPPCLCRSLTERLLKQGCTVQGVPGFYRNDRGEWTVKFHRRTSGILIPAIGIDKMIKGYQILLDIPIRDKDDPPDHAGTKYIWLSSSNQNWGTTSGSPVHLIGNPLARTVYITEGLLKADIAHFLMNRTFIAIAGANNVGQLDPLLALLAQNGTQLIVEAHDMDKFQNKMIHKGASKIYLMSRKYGMDCRRLIWNPNHKGVDDWQLALRKTERSEKEKNPMNLKQQFLHGLCQFSAINDCLIDLSKLTNQPDRIIKLKDYLGLTETEYRTFTSDGKNVLKKILLAQRKNQHFRIYQLDLNRDREPIPFAFMGIKAMHKAGYGQPPAAEYRLVHDSSHYYPASQPDSYILEQLFLRYNDYLPPDYSGRSISPSDVLELYNPEERKFYYCDTFCFTAVRFSPLLCRK